MKNKHLFCLCILVMASLTSGCGWLARLMPGKVSDGVTRLSVRNLATLLRSVTEDADCGFSSKDVLANKVIEGELGKVGTVTWNVKDCTLDFGQGKDVMQDCHGVKTKAFGKVTINSKRVIHGRLTGNNDTPVVPEHPDAVTIELVANFDGFKSEFSSDGNSLANLNGSLSAVVKPHLAVSQIGEKRGLCAVPTSDLTIETLAYNNAEVEVNNGWMTFVVPISGSNVQAQVGKWNDSENSLTGTIVTYGKERTLPHDNLGLDPDYDAEKFRGSFSCNEELLGNVSYQCASLNQRLGFGVAPLSALSIAQIADIVENDRECGFSSPRALGVAKLTGQRGHEGGIAVIEIKDCLINLGKKPQPVFEDCHGAVRHVEGTVSVSGTKTVGGILVHDTESFATEVAKYQRKKNGRDRKGFDETPRPEPVIPTSNEPGAVDLSIAFDNFKVIDSCTMKSDVGHRWHCSRQARFMKDKHAQPGQENIKQGPMLQIAHGTLHGKVTPKVVKVIDPRERTYGVCSEKVPVITFAELRYEPSEVLVTADGNTFAVEVGASEINAVTGEHDGGSNWMEGFISINGDRVDLLVDGKRAVLDPFYEKDVYYHGFQSCKASVATVEKSENCSPLQLLAENAARLIVLNLGGAVKLANASDSVFGCGFKSVGTLLNPKLTNFEDGFGLASFNIAQCLLGGAEQTFTSADCNGKRMGFEGAITITGSLTLEGKTIDDWKPQPWIVAQAAINQKRGLPPMLNVDMKKPDSVLFDFPIINFYNFAAFELEDKAQEPKGKLRILNGRMSGRVQPLVGESKAQRASFYVETPIATFSDIVLSDADVELEAMGMKFVFNIPKATLKARNGFYQGQGNYVEGNITIKTDTQTKAFNIANLPLVPVYPDPYEQGYFDDSYRCNIDLLGPVCSAAGNRAVCD